MPISRYFTTVYDHFFLLRRYHYHAFSVRPALHLLLFIHPPSHLFYSILFLFLFLPYQRVMDTDRFVIFILRKQGFKEFDDTALEGLGDDGILGTLGLLFFSAD